MIASKQSLIDIKDLTVTDSENVANVHSRAYAADYFLTQFGTVFLKTYYSYLIRYNPHSVGVWKNHKLVGFVVGGTHIRYAQEQFLREKIMLVALSTIRAFFKSSVIRNGLYKRISTFGPILLRKFLSFFEVMLPRSSSTIYNTGVSHNMDCRLLSIALVPDVLGTGVASQMIEHFEHKLLGNNIFSYGLSVLKSNKRAIAFYFKHGMRVEKEENELLHFRKDLNSWI